jgi:hypothetical protein
LWQMDVVGGFHLADGTELKAVSGIDDSSRFGVSATLVSAYYLICRSPYDLTCRSVSAC